MTISIKAGKAKGGRRPRAGTSGADVASILASARAAARDPHLAGPVGMLKARGLITERQARAADVYAEIRRAADWALSSPRRTAASPSYEVGRSFTGGTESDDVTANRRAALARFKVIEAAIGGAAVALLDRVCVEQAMTVGRREVEALRAALDRLAKAMALGKAD